MILNNKRIGCKMIDENLLDKLTILVTEQVCSLCSEKEIKFGRDISWDNLETEFMIKKNEIVKIIEENVPKTVTPMDTQQPTVESAPATMVPPVTTMDNVGTKLDRSQDENLKNRVQYGVLQKSAPPTEVNNTNVNKQVDKTIPVKRQIPSVRNQEPTIQELMLSNTRPAN